MGFFRTLFGRTHQEPPTSERAPAARENASAAGPDGRDAAWRRLRDADRIPCPVELVEEDTATGDVAAIFEHVRTNMQIPTVPNITRALAHSPQALKATTHLIDELYLASSLPRPVISMMLYAISLVRGCQYCGSFHRLTCRMVGVDEAMLEAVGNDVQSVTPERVQAIVRFGVKAATASGDLTTEDFETLRSLGISDAEIVEIVAIAATGVYLNVIADTLKIEVDPMIRQGLAA